MTLAPAAEAVLWDAPAGVDYPVRYDVPPAGRQSRWKVALRLLLALPHLVALNLCLYLAELITFVAWLIGVFSGRYDPGLATLPTACVRWYARVITYVGLLRDEYPSFTGGEYPMTFFAPLQTRQSRASIFFRALLVLPPVVVLYVLSTVWGASVALAWFALLITGRYPEGLRRLVIGLNRWLLRVLAYALLLRGDYPPFSLGLHEEMEALKFTTADALDAPPWSAVPPRLPYAPAEPPTASSPPAPPSPGGEPRAPATSAQEPVRPSLPSPTVFLPRLRREPAPPSVAAAADAAQPNAEPADALSESAAAAPPNEPADATPESRPNFFRPRRDPPQS